MMHSRQREYERKLDELEDKLNRAQDEAEDFRKKYEKIEKVNWDQRKQLDDYSRKEERTT